MKLNDKLRNDYKVWKEKSIRNSGYFPIFNGFLEENILKEISGGAAKLYMFIGLRSDNKTGESFYSIESMAKYFDVRERTISTWIKELENLNLIYRIQLKYNSVTHTYLVPYSSGIRGIRGIRKQK